MKTILRYILYVVISIGLGYISFLGKPDYVAALSKTVIPILLTLVTVYSAISGQILVRITSMGFSQDDIKAIVDAMERNIMLEVIILIITFVFLASFGYLTYLFEQFPSVVRCLPLFRNAVVCFDYFYFVIVIYDSMKGLYHMFKGV